MQTLPSPDECRALFLEFRLDPRVQAHLEAVADLAQRAATRVHERGQAVDVELVHRAALLHDIGRSRSHGIDHAIIGARLLSERGFPAELVRCVERHVGGGIDASEAASLGLPPADYTPRTIEEKLVCHIDNLFDGSRRQPLASELAYLRAQNLPHVAAKVERLHREISHLLGQDLDSLP